MKNKWLSNKEKIKDWFIIQRIRFLNFVKEHKYVSAGVGAFLLTCVVLLVAFAGDDPYAGEINISKKSVSAQTQKNAENVYVVDSFSTLVYDVHYALDFSDKISNPESGITRSVEIKATVDQNIDAVWVNTEDYANIEDNGKTIILTMGDVDIGSSVIKGLYLSVRNVKNNTILKPKITIKEITSSESEIEVPEVKVNSSPVPINLTPKVIPGEQYKSSDFAGRYAPFGIMVGIEGYESLQGLHFEANPTINISASQLGGSIDLSDNEKNYGIYKSDNVYFFNTSMVESIAGSGKINSFINSSNKETEKKEEVNVYEELSTPNIKLYGPKTITYGVGDEYYEYGLLNEKNEHICKQSSKQCSIYVDDAAENISKITDEKGTYNVYYTYYTDGDETSKTSVTFKRVIEVVEKEDIFKGNKYTYSDLSDEKEEELIKKYETGEIVNKDSYADFKEIKPDDLTKFPRTYKYEYYSDGGQVVATAYLIIDNSSVTPENLSIDNKGKINKEGANIVGPIYINEDGEKVDDVSNLEVYYVQYTYIDLNGFELKITSKVEKEEKTTTTNSIIYSMEIDNINLNGDLKVLNIDGKNFIPLGSYFVTAKSVRQENNEEDIQVSLTASISEKSDSKSSINYFKAYGTLTGNLDIYSIDKESGSEKKLNFETISEEAGNKKQESKEHLAYGEVIKLKSKVYYSAGADQNLGKIILKYVNLDETGDISPFSAIISSEDDFKLKNSKTNEYIESTYMIYGCNLKVDSSGASICGEFLEYKSYDEFLEATKSNDELRITSVLYEINSLEPNTMLELEQSLRVSRNKSNYGVIQSFVSTETAVNYTDTKINITPFKATTRVFIDDNEQDIIVNGNEKSSSVLAIHPYISLPAQMINTYASGIKNVDTTIKLVLPKGVSYVNNDNYIEPSLPIQTDDEGNLVLTYVFEDVNLNEWLDVIYVDINYDVTIPRGTDLLFRVIIESKDDVTGLSDLSSEEVRTTIRTVTYQNSEIAHGQYVKASTISKENPFEITTKVYNNSKTPIQGLEIVTILPYVDSSNSDYNGYYDISSLGEKAYCTAESPNLVEKQLGTQNIIEWQSCNEYKETSYYGVTAFKYKLDEIIPGGLESNKDYSYTTVFNTYSNDVDDQYVIKTYLMQANENISIKESKVYVMSKNITGVVWEDFDSNGIMDLDEEKISGVTLKLYNSDTNEQIDENESDEKGVYHLVVPSSGNYYVVAEYNTDKYRVSPIRIDIDDKSLISSFTTDNSSELITNSEETDEFNGNPSCNKYEDEDGIQYIKCCYEDGSCEEFIYDEEEFPEYNEPEYYPIVRTQNIEFTDTTKVVNNVNLGLSLRKNYKVKVNKYITKVITTNNLGISNTKDFGNTTLAKLDVKDINNLNIKVIYTIELQNTGYYPGYVYQIKDFIPEGMSFNKDYEENKGWELNEELGYIKNNTLADELIYEGEKRYLTLALDITRKEAGSFVNYAMIDSDDLQILTMGEEEGSEINE